MTKTCYKFFGENIPKWAEDISDELCEEILSDVFKGGNFGIKDKDRADSGMLIKNSKKGKFRNLLSTLHESVMKRYPFLKYLFILYPFFFAFRLIRYVFLMIIGKRRSLTKLSLIANERNELYKKLKIYEED